MAGDDRPEENTLAGRVKRYARVGGAMGGLAARLAGKRYLGIEMDRDRHAQDLRAALGGLKGPLMKAMSLAMAFIRFWRGPKVISSVILR